MSFGAQKSDSKSQAASFYDPTQTAMVNNYATGVQANAANPSSGLAYKPYTGAPLSFGDPANLNAALNYTPTQATGQGYTASTLDPSSIADVKAGQLATTNLQPYENPYTSDVINTTTAQLARQNGIDNTTAAGQATAAGAFGGSRSAVLQNLNTDSYQRNLDQTVAGLNQSNFTQAQGAAGADIGNRLTADQANQQKGIVIGQGNQTATNAASAFGADANNRASLANQQADLQAAQSRLQALGISSDQAQALFGANWQQYLNSQTDPQAVQQLVTQAYGLVPSSPLSNSTSTANSFGFSASAPAQK